MSVKENRFKAVCAAAIVLCVAAGILFSVFAVTGPTESVVYPLEGPIENYNPYVQQFDAFMKGQLNIDVEPAPELSLLENPYDRSLRDSSGIFYLWDRAYYNGNYYSYFGIAPILTLYVPWYAVSHTLPSDRVTLGIFAVITSLFFSLALIQWINKFKIKAPLPLIPLGALAALFGTGIFLFERGQTPFYFIAVAAATAFISAFAFFSLTAFFTEKKSIRRVLMFLSGLSFALAFLSRINSVIPAAAMIACAVIIRTIGTFKEAKEKLPALIIDWCFLAFPVAAALAFSFVMNYLRFGSPLEFGTTYQLTVSDVSLNTVYLGGLWPAFYHYFLQPAFKEERFPHFSLDYKTLDDYGRSYIYIDSNIGVFNFPVSLGSLLLPVFFIERGRKSEKILLSACLISVLATAFLDFCLGGVIFRYIADISPACALMGTVLLFCTAQTASRFKKPFGIITVCFIALVFIVSLAFSFSLSVSANGNLTEMNGETLLFLEKIFG